MSKSGSKIREQVAHFLVDIHNQLTHEDMTHILESSSKGIYLNWFKTIPFILSRTQNYLRTCMDTLFQEAGVTPQISMEVEETMTACNFARYGLGATIMSHKLLERSAFEKYFCLYRLNSPFAQRTSYIYYRLGTYVTPAMTKFLDFVTQTRSYR